VVVTHALRTPIGRFLGSLADVPAVDLGVAAVRAVLAQARLDPAQVDELIFGNGRQAGGGPNPGRQVSVRAGIPVETPAWTLNMACASGLKALDLAVEGIRQGRTRVAVVGGMESMSRMPFFLPDMRRGYRLGHAPVVDGMYRDGFLCPLSDMIMGETAEKLAGMYSIAREEQDRFALESQHRCQAAREAGRFADELVPVEVPGRKGQTTLFEHDEHARDDVRMESLAKLPPVFDKQAGTVTAGNSSGITDGAAALLVMSEERAAELGLEPLAWVGDYTEAGVAPDVMGLGPVPAVRKLQERNARALDDYDLIELNEAFAAQVLACHRELDLPLDRLNVNGGAIALGHPIGATGARIVVTLLHELRRRGGRHGLATLCVSGGLGLATAFERR
jgi:acetyl-CoA C-acetyltransferase